MWSIEKNSQSPSRLVCCRVDAAAAYRNCWSRLMVAFEFVVVVVVVGVAVVVREFSELFADDLLKAVVVVVAAAVC